MAITTKKEREVLQKILDRLKQPNCGCSNGFGKEDIVRVANGNGIEAVSRLYLDTWIIPELEAILKGK